MATWATDVTPDWKPEKRHRASGAEEKKIRAAFAFASCTSCGMRPVERHHITPRSQGGDDVVANLCPLCRSCHTKLEGHESGWAQVAAAIRVYVLTDRDRCVYAISKVGWERFNKRYPLLSQPDGATPGRPPSGCESDWEHWEAPDERVSPWDIAYEPTHFTED